MDQSGATAGSKEFGSRERAAENQYARQKEAEQLKALKATMDAAAAAKKEDSKFDSK
ncbi:ATP synthase inhibitor protein INH1 [Mucor lusitanicus]|uniref:ATPase inhibitor, mitochondrial n=2 Tax=Mucor circinelloides f. lusitanicus TaxID=29924 RepID=A0A168LDU2_MUCCL|nr:ATP synthase inhibitor protein INH1 [Mucor lusitanicus]OAD03411.1 ATP synthase inhibitor protein INH1 [Mucor lusitanicus CBS 277.49]